MALADAAERERQCKLAPIAAGIAAALRRKEMSELGKLLLKAKAIVPHGEWTLWLHEIGVPYRMANEAVRVAKHDRAVAQRWMRSAAE